MRRRRARPSLGVLVVAVTGMLAFGLSACGTRLPNSDFVGAGSGVSAGSAAASGTGSGAGTGSSGSSGVSAGQASTPSGGSASGSGSATAGGATASPGAAGQTGGAGATAGTTSHGSATAAAGSIHGASKPGAAGAAGTTGGATTHAAGGPNGASDVGVTASTITIGNITAINGALGPYAFGVTLPGLQAWVDATNAQGGINGRKIILDTCDDSEDGQQNLACTQRLVGKDHVFALIGNNTDACSSSAHYEYSQGVPDLGFPLCNGYYMYPNMFSIYGAGYPRKGSLPANQEGQAGVYKWFKDQRHVSKGAFFFYIIPVSQQAGYSEEIAAKSVGIATTYEGGGNHEGENPAAPTFDTDVINMRADRVDSVYDALDTAGNAKLCAAMDRQGLTVTAKVSTVEVYGQAVGQWSAPCRDSVYSTDSSAAYSDTSNPVVGQFRKAFSAYEPNAQLHQWALDAYSLGMAFGDAVKSMGANVTRAGFTRWLDSWKLGPGGYTYDGLTAPVSWQPQSYSGPGNDCFAVAQWNDSAGAFVTVAPPTTCYTMPYLTAPFSPDGS